MQYNDGIDCCTLTFNLSTNMIMKIQLKLVRY